MEFWFQMEQMAEFRENLQFYSMQFCEYFRVRKINN